jgi:hypothetical protein
MIKNIRKVKFENIVTVYYAKKRDTKCDVIKTCTELFKDVNNKERIIKSKDKSNLDNLNNEVKPCEHITVSY